MATFLTGVALLALSVLFPANLHLTREIRDPLSAEVVTIEEYCSGNRMVSVSGDRTVIVDYEKQEITEIDRRAGTYSIARFAELAMADAKTMKVNAAAQSQPKVDVRIDRSVSLTREAVEVLIGAAFPNNARAEHEPVLRAAAGGIAANDDTAKATYGLPVAQSFTYGEVTVTSTITRVGAETAPADVLIIPPGAKRVESPAVALRRQLREADHPRQ